MLSVPVAAWAHPFQYGVVKTRLVADQNRLQMQSQISPRLPVAASNLAAYLDAQFVVRQQGRSCNLVLDALTTPGPTQTDFTATITCPQPIRTLTELTIHSGIFTDTFTTFDHFVTVQVDGQSHQLVFDQTHADYPAITRALTPQQWGAQLYVIVSQFVWLGVLHILTGYDHILFLLSLVLLARSLRQVLILVTAFTLAHSVTLTLAGLHIITLSPRVVEPLIALSIVYVAARNIWQLRHHAEADPRSGDRWLVAAGFGLVHGLGFAGALTDAGVPANFFVPALVSFNVGIEGGQLIILLAVLPVLAFIKRWRSWRPVFMSSSAVIAGLAAIWCIGRIFNLPLG